MKTFKQLWDQNLVITPFLGIPRDHEKSRINNTDDLRSKLGAGVRLLVALGAFWCIAPVSTATAGCITAGVSAEAPCIDDDFGEIERYLGTAPATNLAGLSVAFANASRPVLLRYDIVITDVQRSLFTNFFGNFGDRRTGANNLLIEPPVFGGGLDEFAGCDSPLICPGDEVGLDGFTATFAPANGDPPVVFGINNVQIVAQETTDPATGLVTGAEQNKVWVLWSIRGNDVKDLSPSTLTVKQGDDAVLATFVLQGKDAEASISSMTNGLLTAVDGNVAGAEPPAPTPTALAVTKVEFKRSKVPGVGELKIEGNAAPGANILLDGRSMGVAGADGRFRVQDRSFRPPLSCQVTLSDGTNSIPVSLPNCL